MPMLKFTSMVPSPSSQLSFRPDGLDHCRYEEGLEGNIFMDLPVPEKEIKEEKNSSERIFKAEEI